MLAARLHPALHLRPATTVSSMVMTTEDLWETLHDQLLGFIHARVPDEAIAEDILQDVFLKIHARIDTLRDQDRLQSWVWQIVRNALSDHYRTLRPMAELPREMAAPNEATDDDDGAAQRLRPSVRAMVAALPGPYREALMMTEYQGLTQQELARRTGISLSGAKSRVQRGREKLKALLLECCHFELDRRGGIINYRSHCPCCTITGCEPNRDSGCCGAS